MASKQHVEDVKAMIDSFYKFAGVAPSWDGAVNEKVAEVFGVSILWLATGFGKALFKHFQSKVSITCAKGVIYKWGRELDMASMGLAYRASMKKWA